MAKFSFLNLIKGKKVIINKKLKLPLTDYTSYTASNLKIGRLNELISSEEVELNTDKKSDITVLMKNAFTASKIMNKTDIGTPTIVLTQKKSESLDDVLLNANLCILKRASALIPIMKFEKVSKKWSKQLENDMETPFVNYLYLPGVPIFYDIQSIVKHENSYKVNLLIIAEPDRKKSVPEEMSKPTHEEYIKKVVEDTADAVVKLQVKHPIYTPYMDEFTKKFDTTQLITNNWKNILNSNRYNEHVDISFFCIENEDQFVTFETSRVKEIV